MIGLALEGAYALTKMHYRNSFANRKTSVPKPIRGGLTHKAPLNLRLAARIGDTYDQGMLFQGGISAPLMSGYMTPYLKIFVLGDGRSAKIIKVPVVSDDGTPDSTCYMLHADKPLPFLTLSFDKRDPDSQIKHVQLSSVKGYRVPSYGGFRRDGGIGFPEEFYDACAYITQTILNSNGPIDGRLIYADRFSSTTIRQVLREFNTMVLGLDPTKSADHALIGGNETEIDRLIRALFDETVLSSKYHSFEEIPNDVLGPSLEERIKTPLLSSSTR